MATQHTPGPWSMGPWIDSMGGHVYRVISGAGRRVSAVSVYGRRPDGSHGGRALKAGGRTKTVATEECEANAHLIAAAPDHADIGWAMCVAAARWEAWGDGRGEFCMNGLRHATKLDPFGIPEVTPAMREAIAKARGETA